jgi:predicted NBD/HSP70 family sugar kinase
MPPSTTVVDIRRRNRGQVLRSILLAGETTRAQLGAETHLSTATVTNVVSALIAEGLVEEVGTLPSNGGRPIARLSPRGDAVSVIGADIGEHGITVELFDLGLQRVASVFEQIPARIASPETIGATLRGAVGRIRAEHATVADRLVGLGLGLPGIVDTTPDGGTTIYAQSLGWDPIGLDDLYADPEIAIFADNGAKTMATAEAWRGGARDVAHCIVALVGRGLGAGFLVDGTLLRGLSSSAGEWGHTKVSLDGRLCACGARGCLEAYVGGGAIMARWQDAGGTPHGAEEEALAELIAAADGGDGIATGVLDETVEILGLGLANLVNIFNPEVIIVGGWTGLALADARLSQLVAATRANALDRPAQQVRLEVTRLGHDAVALGAALLPIQHLIEGTLPAPIPEEG